jgi:predicted transcriptional regulator
MAESIGCMIDNLDKIRDKKRGLDEQVKDLEAQYRELTEKILDRMATENMPKASGRRATVSRSETIVGQLEDWEALTKYISRTKNFQLFERRISAAAFRELFEKKGEVPGVKPFTKVTLKHTSLKE